MLPVQNITILGATGSIGASTLEVIALHPQRFRLYAVTAHRNVDAMLAICRRFEPEYVVMSDSSAARQVSELLTQEGLNCKVFSGVEALTEIAGSAEADIVMAAIVGAAGLKPTLAAVEAGKRVLLANKEALVMSGGLFMQSVERFNAQLLPVDSEHNAIFQCLSENGRQQAGLINLADEGISKILLTGSGGPFLTVPVETLAQQSPQAACNHPNWSMGQKISVDSATMLNKGLEYIEARWLFNCQPHELDIIIHPQSIIHSMVQYHDGSVLAQLGQPDMKTPIAYCLHYPERSESGVEPLDFTRLSALTFTAPDEERFPCLSLARQACWQGQAATTALNAANEVAVDAFLHEHIGFTRIAEVCDAVLQRQNCAEPETIEAVMLIDSQARKTAREVIAAWT